MLDANAAWCKRCKTDQPADSFVDAKGRRLLLCSGCREQARAENRERRDRLGVEHRRRMNLRHKYGIEPEEYDALLAGQSNRCAICSRHESETVWASRGRPRLDGAPPAVAARLVVDHCHDSRVVRGLLCPGCNAGIGNFLDSPELLAAAIEYLRQGEEKCRNAGPLPPGFPEK